MCSGTYSSRIPALRSLACRFSTDQSISNLNLRLQPYLNSKTECSGISIRKMKSAKKVFILIISYIAVIVIIGKSISSISEKAANESKPETPSSVEIAELSESGTFLETMRKFPWGPFNAASQRQKLRAARKYANQLVQELYPFLLRAPPTPANPSCKPPPIDLTATIHECIPLRGPRKIAVLMTFGYDVDLLDIYLHELDDLVDKIFLIEDPTPHNRLVKSKPLLWEILKRDPRFSPFVHKIVHFIVEHTDGETGKSIYANERRQKRQLWDKFLEWNNQTQFFQDRDLLWIGDPDEIPYRNNVAFLKNCQLPSDPIDIGSWTPLNSLDTLYKADHFIRDHPYAAGIPTFWTLRTAKMYQVISGKRPGRQKGRTKAFLLGGIHLTRYMYPPHIMIKYLTCGECGWKEIEGVIDAGMVFRDRPKAGKRFFNDLPRFFKGRRRGISLDEFKRENPEAATKIVKVPWYLQCNLNRYPAVKGKWDPRLK